MKSPVQAFDLYIVWRDWLDWYAFSWFVAFVAAVFGLGAAIWTTVARYTAHDWHVFGVYVLSEFLLFLPFAPDKTKKIRDLDGEVLVWTIDAITRHGYILGLRDRMLGDARGAALWGGGIGAGLLIGAVVVMRIVHRRNSRRRRGAGEKHVASVPRRRTGHWFDRILRLLRAPVRFVWKTAKGCAHSGSTEHQGVSSRGSKHHAADSAASGSARRQGSAAVPAAFGKLTARLFELARSGRLDRADSAEVPQGQAHHRLDQLTDNEAHDDPSSPHLPATSSPAAPTTSAPALLDDSANPRRSEPKSRMPHAPGQVSHDVSKSEAGGVASSKPGSSQEPQDAARDDSADKSPSPAPHGERAASDNRMPGSNERLFGTRHGARRRRRRASQDFY